MRHDWHTLMRSLNRLHPGVTIKYVAILEWTAKGQPHLHILADMPFTRQRWLSRHWQRIHGAPVVDVRRVRSQRGAATYLTAYLTKSQAMPPRLRKWSASRGYLPPQEPGRWPDFDEQPVWTYAHRAPVPWLDELRTAGYELMDGPGNSVMCIPPPWLALDA